MDLEKIIVLLGKLSKSQKELDEVALRLLQLMEHQTEFSTKFVSILEKHNSQIKEIYKIVKLNQNSLNELIKHQRGLPK